MSTSLLKLFVCHFALLFSIVGGRRHRLYYSVVYYSCSQTLSSSPCPLRYSTIRVQYLSWNELLLQPCWHLVRSALLFILFTIVWSSSSFNSFQSYPYYHLYCCCYRNYSCIIGVIQCIAKLCIHFHVLHQCHDCSKLSFASMQSGVCRVYHQDLLDAMLHQIHRRYQNSSMIDASR